MAPSTRLGARPERRVDYRTIVQAGSVRSSVDLEDTLPSEEPATRTKETKEKGASKPARDAQGRFIKSDSSAKPNLDHKKVVKRTSPPKKEEKARPLKTECVLCAATKLTKRCFKASNLDGVCEHFEGVCNLCVQKLIKTKISERQLTDARLTCVFPGCEAAIDHKQLKMVMSSALFETWDTALTKHLLAVNPLYIACLNPKCSAYFSIENCNNEHKTSSTKNEAETNAKDRGGDKAACPHCKHELCLSCTRPWHSGSCDSVKQHEDNQSENAIKNMGAKPCPKCGINIVKRGGCNHMTCQQCRHNFCWECLGQFKGRIDDHAETCSHRRPMIANDVGNFVHENLNVHQINALFEHARQDRDAGRDPRPTVHLFPGLRVVNGAVLAHPQPRPDQGEPVAQGFALQLMPARALDIEGLVQDMHAELDLLR